jgi:hypothetical protein
MQPTTSPIATLSLFLFLGGLLGLNACLPYGLGGTLGGEEIVFEDAVYFELRGTDSGTATPFHDIELWLTPLEDPCTRLPTLLDELAALRAEQQDGLPPVDYCNAWEALMFAYVGDAPFWHAQIRMKALPRAEDVSVDTLYPFHDETALELPDSPSFDADVLLFPAPTFDACAEEFSGTTSYVATEFSALGGEAEITGYSQDSEVETVLNINLDSVDTEPFQGGSTASYCIPARDFPLQFGPGL